VKVRFTPTARRQFLKALSYIHSDKPSAARAFRRRVEKSLRRLGEFPQSGRVLPEFPDLPHREIIVPPYRFFYRTDKRTVWIVGVLHGKQDADNPE